MGLGIEDLRIIKEIRGNDTGGKCAILGHCTFWYGKEASLIDFKNILKFDSVETFDINGSPTYKVDLQEKLQNSFFNSYDIIIDSGTLYSVFDVASVFENIVSMLKINGKIWHQTNLIGHFGRGYWSISPSVLYEFYTQNGFSVERMGYYIKEIGNGIDDRWIDFDPKAHNLASATSESFSFTTAQASYRGLARNDTSLMCLATKKENVTKIIKPVPSHYIRTNGA